MSSGANSQSAVGICSWCGGEMPAAELDQKPCDTCFAAWPKCAVPVCQNKCCLRLNSVYCWPHTPGQQLEKEDIDLLSDEESEDTNVGDSYAR